MSSAHADPSGQSGRSVDARLRRYTAGCALVALGLVAITLAATGIEPTHVPEAWVVAALWVAVALSSTIRFPLFGRGARGEASTLNELGLVPTVVLLEPVLAIPVVATAYFVGELVDQGRPTIRHVFNVSAQTAAVAAGGGLFHLVVDGFSVSVAPLSMGLVAAGVVVGINLAAITPVVGILRDRPFRRVFGDLAELSVYVDLGTAAVGLLVAALLVVAPLALPLLLIPALLYRGQSQVLSRGLIRLEAERDRFERTVAGSGDGVVLAGPDGTIEVWNPAMESLSGLSRAEVLGKRLVDVGWGQLSVAPSDTDPGTEHLEIAGRALDVRKSTLVDGDQAVYSVRDVTRERELGRIREDLVSRISHELRTPLTTVDGFLETLAGRWEELDPGTRHQLVVAAARGAERLTALVDNLLTWSRIEARASRGDHTDEQDVADLLDVATRVGATHGNGAVQIADEVEDGDARVAMSEADVTAVVEHLVHNAELYGAPPVRVAVAGDDGCVRLTVTDHGVGLPEGFADEAFQPFRQGVEGLQRTGRGLGLGLAIVHSLVIGSGGEIRVEQPEHRGARFVVRLPRVDAEVS